MGLSTEQLRKGIDAVAGRDSNVSRLVAQLGYPEPRHRPTGYNALLRTLIAQQISVKAAQSIYAKTEAALGNMDDPAVVLAASDETMRACGLSRQKIDYARSLAHAVATGHLDFEALKTMPDEEAIAVLSSVKGFGRWSGEIYLLFAEGREDVWPADDIALQEGVRRIMGLPERPKAKALRQLVEPWSPHRGAMAIFCWHVYANSAPLG